MFSLYFLFVNIINSKIKLIYKKVEILCTKFWNLSENDKYSLDNFSDTDHSVQE
jgi:hypothetical protein